MVLAVSKECRVLDARDFERWNRTHKVYIKFPEYSRKGFEKLPDDLWIVDERLMEERNPSLKPYVVLKPRD